MREKRGEMSPKSRRVLGKPPSVVCSLYYPNMTLPCKNNKQKLAGNAARTPMLSSEISVHAQKFPARYYDKKNIFLTYQ